MKSSNSFSLLVLGALIWVAGTIYYSYRGPHILETTAIRYWISFAISPLVSVLLCVGILRWMNVEPAQWTSGMTLLALPGMIGEAIVLSNFSTFMPRLHAPTGPRYAAFLFTTYAVVLGVAEIVTLKANAGTSIR